MTRQIILDTETTGLDWKTGDRVIEIGCIELVARKASGRHFHRYLNPEREIEAGAMAVHGITNEFLVDKPKFREIAAELVAFLSGAELVIHNAAFDTGFLNHEFALLSQPPLDSFCAGVIDTWRLARELHPGRKNSLDALCERYEVDNSNRQMHGALLDAELLAEVYLAMTRGQESLAIELETAAAGGPAIVAVARGPLKVLRAGPDELAAHERLLAEIDKASGGKCVWRALDAKAATG
ncbi:MAG: DNA polymerase III subunit epsilon [Rhodocyclaceae bacterium]|nr:DNA polymerase III subunit epsilon [Rhodocyclaceae bacterium]MBX3668919.1 DNA polymerase III subunit epsilon [Rhodocyclaceae bacterium]